ncbi:uncharacterized protein LOC129594677 [Paramacrobiotus metropolitanus]|uniref:uncharacterized protein LOC129594677 n=1 Tax=Paramacrobiotus metropolitanus TaxID=2943436 RepID=UPI0024458EE2|nr:uncharacterized protein LOC129594677 [Paramacrobiotus metropolitanus]
MAYTSKKTTRSIKPCKASTKLISTKKADVATAGDPYDSLDDTVDSSTTPTKPGRFSSSPPPGFECAKVSRIPEASATSNTDVPEITRTPLPNAKQQGNSALPSVHRRSPQFSQPQLVCRHASPIRSKKVAPLRPYSLSDYKQLNLNVKLGGLGPNTGPEQERIRSVQKRLRDLAKQWHTKNKEKESVALAAREARATSNPSEVTTPSARDSTIDRAAVSSHGHLKRERLVNPMRYLRKQSPPCRPIVLPVLRLNRFMKESIPVETSSRSASTTQSEKKIRTELKVLRKSKEMDKLAENQLAVLGKLLDDQANLG